MSKWIIVEVHTNGKKVALPTEYDKYEDACTEQEIFEDVNPHKAYLIYTNDEWMYEVENGRV